MDITKVQFINAMQMGFEPVLHGLEGLADALDTTIDFDALLDMFHMPASLSGIDLSSWQIRPEQFKGVVRRVVEAAMFEFEEENGPVSKGSRNFRRNQPHAPSHHNPDPFYLSELLVRGAMTTRQAASSLDIDHSQLLGYLDTTAPPPHKVPYLVQFALENLIGVRRAQLLRLRPMATPMSSTSWNCYVAHDRPLQPANYAATFGIELTADQIAEVERAISALPSDWCLLVEHDVGADGALLQC